VSLVAPPFLAPDSVPDLSWIVPMYRTAASLPELVRRIETTAACCGASSEIVLVDDACPEGSARCAERLVAAGSALRILTLERNRGQDGALREGLRACRGRWAVLLDADLQDPPEAVERLWLARSAGSDAVFARRSGAYETSGRLLTSRLYRRGLAWIGGLPDGACLFVMLSRPMIDAIAATRSARTSILAALSGAGRDFAIVPVQRSTRRHGRSAYSARARLDKAARSLWQTFLARRLRRAL
jgi:glycosyltransferase involved in cell wall biosynthesis